MTNLSDQPVALLLLLTLAAVLLVPPAISGVADWWSGKLRRSRVWLRTTWARFVESRRKAVRHWLSGGDQ